MRKVGISPADSDRYPHESGTFELPSLNSRWLSASFRRLPRDHVGVRVMLLCATRTCLVWHARTMPDVIRGPAAPSTPWSRVDNRIMNIILLRAVYSIYMRKNEAAILKLRAASAPSGVPGAMRPGRYAWALCDPGTTRPGTGTRASIFGMAGA